MKNVPSSKDVSKRDCNQYYEVLCKIIEESQQIVNVSIDFASLMQETIKNIMNHESTESRYNSKNDKILIGFLNLCEKIIKIKSTLGSGLDDFANYLFNTCLFNSDPEQLLEKELDFSSLLQ
jgi:ubiquitin carboxyl-terminal hydrolase 34